MTENEKVQNGGELMDFVHHHNLMDSYSNIIFTGAVTIETEHDVLENHVTQFIVTNDGYDNYGTLYIHEDIDHNVFPSKYEAKWQTIKHVDKSYLKINGSHPSLKIGKYEVRIIPHGKLWLQNR